MDIFKDKLNKRNFSERRDKLRKEKEEYARKIKAGEEIEISSL